mgnify:CR=1 FL=1
MKKVLLIVNKAPFGSVFAAEALRAGIAFAGMDLETKLVFANDGVFCLTKNQHPEIAEMTSLKEGFGNAEEFGLKIFASAESVSERNITNDSLIEVKQATTQQIRSFIDEAETIINF